MSIKKVWSIIQMEAYCGFGWDSRLDRFVYRLNDDLTTTRISNPQYDPEYKEERPSYCPECPQYICLANDCPYLYHCEWFGVEEDDE